MAHDPRFEADRKIRLEEAKGAVNAIIVYGSAGDAEGSNRWRQRLAAVARDFPLDDEIQEQAGKCGLSYVDQRAQGWPYGRP